MTDTRDFIRDVANNEDARVAGKDVRWGPPTPIACDTCPWRAGCQAMPPAGRPDATPLDYYMAEGREALWEGPRGDGRGLAAGFPIGCHKRPSDTANHYCAGGKAITHRELLRWWEAGASRHTCAPFGGLDAIRLILVRVLGSPHGLDDDGSLVTPGLSLDEGDADQVQPHYGGLPLMLDEVAPILHPAVLDTKIVSGLEVAPPPTTEELERWAALRVGADWRDGPEARDVHIRNT